MNEVKRGRKPLSDHMKAVTTSLRLRPDRLAVFKQLAQDCQYGKDIGMPEYSCAGKCQYAQPAQEPLVLNFGDGTKSFHAGYSNDENKTPSLSIGNLGNGIVGEASTHKNLAVINNSDLLVEMFFNNQKSLDALLSSVYEVYKLNNLTAPPAQEPVAHIKQGMDSN